MRPCAKSDPTLVHSNSKNKKVTDNVGQTNFLDLPLQKELSDWLFYFSVIIPIPEQPQHENRRFFIWQGFLNIYLCLKSDLDGHFLTNAFSLRFEKSVAL